MSQPFNPGTPTSNGHALSSAPSPYHPALSNFSAFPGLTSLVQSLGGQSHMSLSAPAQQSESFPLQPQPPSSSNNSDLENLERLKREILEGQNPIYKAVPQPDFLESLYLGRLAQARNSAPAHPDQIATGPSATTTSQSSLAVHSDGNTKSSEVERLTGLNLSKESHSVDDKVRHCIVSSVSVQAAQNMNGGINSSQSESISLERSPSLPQIEPKFSEIDQRSSFTLGMPSRYASKLSSNGPVDSSKPEADTPGQLAALSSSDSVSPVRPSTGKSPITSVPLGKPVFTSDPPYDPKESLRNLEGGDPPSNFNDRHATDSYESRPFDSRNGRSSDSSQYMERRGDYGGEWDERYDYSYDEHRLGSGDYRDRQFNSMPSIDYGEARFREVKHQGRNYSHDDRADANMRCLVPGFPDRSNSDDDRSSRDPLVVERYARSTNGVDVTNPANGTAPALATAAMMAAPAVNSQHASPDDQLKRNTIPNTYTRSTAEGLRPDVNSRLQPIVERNRQPSIDYRSQQENNKAPALEERIGDGVPSALEERIGIRIPLEERISSPPVGLTQPTSALQERIGDRPPLEDRISSRPTSTDVRRSAGPEPNRLADTRSIPTPLSLVRPRPVDEKAISSVSAPASAPITQQRVEASGTVERSDEGFQPRYLAYGSYSATRSKLQEELTPKERYFDDSSDPRLVPSAAYRGERGRSYTDEGKSFADVGHYERPIIRERDSVVLEERASTNLDSREWRERGSYLKAYASRPDGSPFSGSTPRVWTANTRSGRPPDLTSDDRDRYSDHNYDRRSTLPPHSWDRDGPTRIRPPPEVYPPPGDPDHDRYGTADFREGLRIRGRSPSPNPLRRSTYGATSGDLRPAKRVRDETYCDDRERRYSDRRPHAAPPPPSTTESYYDSRAPYALQDAHDHTDRGRISDVAYYDRRVSDMGPPRSPPYTSRAIYSRPDLDRYNAAPPRTA